MSAPIARDRDARSANIAARLSDMATSQPDTRALFFPTGRGPDGKQRYRVWTYAELDRESDYIAAGLEDIGISRGVRTVLMVKPSLEFFALTFGIFKAGAVPVMIDPGIDKKALKTCLAEAEPEAFIGITLAHVARKALGWGKPSVTKLVTVGKRLFWGGHTQEKVRARGKVLVDGGRWQLADTRPDEVAAILFTSGSTGVPKGVVYEHRHFMAQVDLIRQHYDIQPGEVDLPTFPLFALFDPALGMTTIIPDMDARKPGSVDPLAILEPLEEFGVTNMFGSPALVQRVGRYAEAHGVKRPKLRRIISSGAPVSAQVMRPFATMLEGDAAIHPSYGATESLPVASISSHEVLSETGALTDAGHGICVGHIVDGMEVRVIRITDEAIDEMHEALLVPGGTVGELCVRGPVVTEQYFGRPESTRLAKIREGETLWHRMGDLGYFDERGRLWFCGRKAHRVELSDETLFSVPCEGVFNAHEKVLRSALVRVEVTGEPQAVLWVELEPEHAGTDQAALFAELRVLAAEHDNTRRIERFLVHPGFPVDIRHNAKIGRPQLAVEAAKILGLSTPT